MPRPNTPDPKLPLTIRLRASVLARIGDDARTVIEALVIERYGLPAEVASPKPRLPPPAIEGLPLGPRKACAALASRSSEVSRRSFDPHSDNRPKLLGLALWGMKG